MSASNTNDRLRAIIADEVSKQIAILKQELKTEFTRVIQDQIGRSQSTLRADFERDLGAAKSDLNTAIIAAQGGGAIAAPMPREQARALANAIRGSVMKEIKPELEKLSSWVLYHTQDTDGLIMNYRREVDRQHNDQKMLTDGKTHGIYGPYTRTFFTDDD